MSSSHSEIALELAEEFIDRWRRGERPSIGEYTRQHPELADEIRKLFPAMAMLESIAIEEESVSVKDTRADTAIAEPVLAQLGDYRIIREVGRGGMGIVYEAEQVSLGRHVALKVLPGSKLLDSKQKRRFEREARAAARLHHTNVVPVFGVGESEGVHYYVMQFIQGLPLDEVIDELKRIRDAARDGSATPPTGEIRVYRRHELSAEAVARTLAADTFGGRASEVQASASTLPASELDTIDHADRGTGPGSSRTVSDSSPSGRGKLSDTFSLASASASLPGQPSTESSARMRRRTYWHSVAHIGIQVASALQHAHDQGILHRDVKPSNLLLDMRGTVWVTDFGLAKASDQHDLTHSGDILGTLCYMPPEAFEGKSDARSDLYSLGLTLYEMLALAPAFSEKDRQRLIKLVTTGAPARLERLNRDIPRDLVTIVHKAIERDPEHRYRSASQLSADLERFLNDEPIQARRVPRAERLLRWSRRNRAVASLGAALVGLLVTAAIASSVAAFRFRKLADDREIARSSAVEAQKAEETERVRAERQERLARRSAYVAQINLAQRAAAESGEGARVDELLDHWTYRREREDLRGWEWYYLKSGEDRHRLSVPRIGGGASLALWNPARPLIATLCGGGFELFDAGTGRLVRRFTGARVAATSGYAVAGDWSPDGRYLAAGWFDGTVRIWAADTGIELRVERAQADIVEVAWSPDGRRIAARDGQGLVGIGDSSSGRQVAAWSETGSVRRLAWRGPEQLTFLAEDVKVITRDVDGSRSVDEALPPVLRDETISAIAWNGDGSLLALGYAGGSVGLFDRARPDASRHRAHEGPPGSVVQLAWSPGEDRIAMIRSGVVHVFHVGDGEEIPAPDRVFRYRQPIHSLSWSPDGKRLALSSGAVIRICDLELDATPRTRESVIAARATGVVWSPDGDRLAVGVRAEAGNASGWSVQVWRAHPWELLRKLPGPFEDKELAWNPDSRHLAVIGRRQEVLVLNTGTGETVSELDSVPGEAHCLAWHPDGARLAAGCGEGEIGVVNVSTGQRERLLAVAEVRWGSRQVRSAAWSPDGRWLASLARNGTLNLWDAGGTQPTDTRQVGVQYEWPSDVTVVGWSPDGTRLAAARTGGSTRGRISLWKVADGRMTDSVELSGHRPDVWGIAWSTDGRRLASAGADRAVKLWDVESIVGAEELNPGSRQSRELLTLHGHVQAVRSVAWNPRWPVIASASADGALLLWDASTGFELDRSPRSLGQNRKIRKEALTARELRWRGETHAFLGDWESAARDFDEVARLESGSAENAFWFFTPWWATGYYDRDLDVPVPPESQTDPWAPIPAGGGAPPRRWLPVAARPESIIGFPEILGGAEGVSACALNRVYATRDGRVAALVGSDDRPSVRVNGERVHNLPSNRGPIVDEDAFFVDLRAGWNTILARVTNDLGGHSFILRLSTEPSALARAHETAGEWEQALLEWTRAVEADPHNVVLQMGRGLAALQLGRRDVELLDLENVFRQYPEDIDLRLRLAPALAAGSPGRVAEILEEAVERDPERVRSLAYGRLSAGRYREAVLYLRALSATEPQPTIRWHETPYRLALVLWHLGEKEEYEALCRRILAAFGDSRNVQIGERTSKMCLFAGAITDPDAVASAARLADYASENVAAAISRGDAPQVVEPAAWHSRGIADYRRGRDESALRSFQKSEGFFAALDPAPWIQAMRATERLFSAMALHRLERTEAALANLAEYHRIAVAIPASEHGGDLLIMKATHREARELIGEVVDEY